MVFRYQFIISSISSKSNWSDLSNLGLSIGRPGASRAAGSRRKLKPHCGWGSESFKNESAAAHDHSSFDVPSLLKLMNSD